MAVNFKYSFDNKRYHTFNYYLKTHYQAKVAKVTLDAHFTCPNRDGSKGFGGCYFCSLKGSGDANRYAALPILTQYSLNKALLQQKWPVKYFIPYFQSYSNTYAPLDKIKELIEPFLKLDEAVEIALATRCDCLAPETIAYLNTIGQLKPLRLELGLQTTNKKSAAALNMQYDFTDFQAAMQLLKGTSLKICVHLLNGLPGEKEEDMLQTVRDIRDYPLASVKFHMLYLVKGTKLSAIYQAKPFKLLTQKEYIEILIKQLELLKPTTVIERIGGDPLKEELIAPTWLLNKTDLRNKLDRRMVELDTYQGKYYPPLKVT